MKGFYEFVAGGGGTHGERYSLRIAALETINTLTHSSPGQRPFYIDF
jgi:hypothetical protein